MKNKVIVFSLAILALTLGGAIVFLNLHAKPIKKDSDDPKARKAGDFDGERALKYIKELCDIGPRISGTEGMQKQQELLQKYFEKLGAKVTLQKFDGRQPSQSKAVAMANMIVSWHPESKKRVLLCGHYDTKPIADRENFKDWRKPFVSANDGTSTVAFLMELGNQMKDLKLDVGVDFVFFDAEEFINAPNQDKFFLGSEYFAADYKRNKPEHKYIAGVLYDLFAGIGATYPIEQNSKLQAGAVLEDFWKAAADEGEKRFLDQDGPSVLDDHMALNKVGIPTIDIIDFDYPHWHLLSDRPDQCSAESMASVAKVTIAWLKKLK